MVSTPNAKKPVITQSKINHKSPVLNSLVRFVTEETVALLFNLQPDEIYRIDCWRHVVYVHGKGVSKFCQLRRLSAPYRHRDTDKSRFRPLAQALEKALETQPGA